MEVDSSQLYIDNIHRLPNSGKGPRPVIVKFIYKMDKIYVWENRFILKENGSQIIIRELYDATTERNIKSLLLVRREAISQRKKVKLVKDKLTIDD